MDKTTNTLLYVTADMVEPNTDDAHRLWALIGKPLEAVTINAEGKLTLSFHPHGVIQLGVAFDINVSIAPGLTIKQ